MSDEIEQVTAYKWAESYHPTPEAARQYRARSEVIAVALAHSHVARSNAEIFADFVVHNAGVIEKILERLNGEA